MTRPLIASCTLTLLAVAAAACGPGSDVDEPGVRGTPRVRILVNDRPHDATALEADVDEARYGDPLHVVVDGLAAGAIVDVVTTAGAGHSRARFAADDAGTVDLARDAPDDDGSWIGADGEAHMATLVDPPGGALDLSVTVTVLDEEGEELASDVLARRYIDDGITVIDVADGTARGLLAFPPGDGPFPAVLVFGGSEGGTGTGTFNALYLASLGYAAFGVGYFGAEGLPATLSNVPLEILEQDLARLAADPRVDADHIAVMGGSRGGELALLVGATFPTAVAAVVASVPSGYVWGSVDGGSAAWTFAGEALPAVPSSGVNGEVFVDHDGIEHLISRGAFLADIDAADPAALDAATIRAEDIVGPVLLLAGADDQLWPSCEMAAVARDRRDRDDDEFHCFDGAGHAGVGIPGWSAEGSDESFFEAFSLFLVLGGDAQKNGRAIRDGDTALRAFLERTLR